MGSTVWIGADTLTWPEGGGHGWVYLNWALGLRSLGCDVVWLESADPGLPESELVSLLEQLERNLEPYGLSRSIALSSKSDDPLSEGLTERCVDLDLASDADLLLNLSYDAHGAALRRFRRTAMLDIDPGLTQTWASAGDLHIPDHDVYLTIGEGAAEPSKDTHWHHVAPCVALDWWPVRRAADDAAFSTVSAWDTHGDWVIAGEHSYPNNKKTGFLPFLSLPSLTDHPLELALCLEADEDLKLVPHEETERRALESLGWRVVHSYAVARSPVDYQRYLQRSKGEFSCAKPSGPRMQNAWISDRTLCYLASGKPAVVQHTGPSRILPDAAGLFRFRTMPEAARALDEVVSDYERQCGLARQLAEEHFDAEVVGRRLLELTLP